MAKERAVALAIVVSLSVALPAAAQTFDILHAFYEPPGAPDAADRSGRHALRRYVVGWSVRSRRAHAPRPRRYRHHPSSLQRVRRRLSPGRLLRGVGRRFVRDDIGDTGYGGPDWGTLFKWDGRFTTLHRFVWRNGANPSSLVQGSDGALYGTTSRGGWFGEGTLFKWNGSLTILHDFMSGTISNGGYPGGPLVVARMVPSTARRRMAERRAISEPGSSTSGMARSRFSTGSASPRTRPV
jgi:uncharacterized repeat protein (TIGR03803 family)